LIVDIGDTNIRIVPIQKYKPVFHAINTLKYGGRNISDYLSKLIFDKYYMDVGRSVVDEIKEKYCKVTDNLKTKLNNLNDTDKLEYSLPNRDNVINLDKELYQCPEALFNTRLMGNNQQNLQDAVYSSILSCNTYRDEMYSNIILSGGSSMFPGLRERLYNELVELAPVNKKIRIIDDIIPDRNFQVWNAGKMLLNNIQTYQYFLSRDEYNEGTLYKPEWLYI